MNLRHKARTANCGMLVCGNSSDFWLPESCISLSHIHRHLSGTYYGTIPYHTVISFLWWIRKASLDLLGVSTFGNDVHIHRHTSVRLICILRAEISPNLFGSVYLLVVIRILTIARPPLILWEFQPLEMTYTCIGIHRSV